MYHIILKEGYGNNNYLKCPDILYDNFMVLNSLIALDKLDLVCEKLLKINLPAMIQVLLLTKTQSIFLLYG